MVAASGDDPREVRIEQRPVRCAVVLSRFVSKSIRPCNTSGCLSASVRRAGFRARPRSFSDRNCPSSNAFSLTTPQAEHAFSWKNIAISRTGLRSSTGRARSGAGLFGSADCEWDCRSSAAAPNATATMIDLRGTAFSRHARSIAECRRPTTLCCCNCSATRLTSRVLQLVFFQSSLGADIIGWSPPHL
jgi:hypothetical protein